MLTIDLKKQLKPYLSPGAQPQIVDVPEMPFLMIDGAGDPNTAPAYAEAVSALYTLAYTLKFALKKGPAQIDFPVMASEGLWWMENMAEFSLARKADWLWTMMIVLPEQVTPEMVEAARAEGLKKKGIEALKRVRLERYPEGLSAQVMHTGPYAAEAPTIRMLHEFIAAQGHSLRGKHHEIYMGDPRRTAPEKLKTIIRQPVS